jgi:STE24 endopeptidase
VLGLPLAALARRRAVDVGLITQGWRGWAGDLLKAQAISAPLSAAGGALVVAGMRRFGDRWWLPGAGGLVGLGVLSLVAGPTLLDPIFNRFEPAEPELRDRVEGLAERAGVRVDRVLVMDASRRTTASNAYVTGLGPTKRVVLFDTLLRDFDPAQVDFVVAHELAHVRHRDVPRALGLLAVAAPALTWTIARLSGARADAGALPRLSLAAGVVAPLFGILANAVSRRAERRADRFAMDLVEDPRAQIAFQRDICVRNVAEPEPPRWVRVVFGSHPTTLERIAMAEAAASAS